MMKDQLRDFIDRITDTQRVSDDDVKRLQDEILDCGITSRLEVESLLALDRVASGTESWGCILTKLVVEFVVWKRLPHGVVSNDDAFWLATVLDISGPSPNAMNGPRSVAKTASEYPGRRRASLSPNETSAAMPLHAVDAGAAAVGAAWC